MAINKVTLGYCENNIFLDILLFLGHFLISVGLNHRKAC
jgi:hypothetical protein